MPLATSESGALKLGLTPRRILLPDREIRRRGIRSEGDKGKEEASWEELDKIGLYALSI